MNYNYTVAERFMRYVQIDTQSDPEATCFPSTEKQKDLARVLEQELKDIGLTEVVYMRPFLLIQKKMFLSFAFVHTWIRLPIAVERM